MCPSELKSGRTIVDQRSNNFGLWPLRFRIKLFSVLVPSAFVGDRDFSEVVIKNGLVKVDDKLGRISIPNFDHSNGPPLTAFTASGI